MNVKERSFFFSGSTMPKVTEEYREAKRDEITSAALRCFAKKGFGASMADIIAEAGLSAGAIYGHFASKHDVMLAVADRLMGNRMDDFQAVRAQERLPSPGEVVTRVLTGLVEELTDTGLLLRVWGESVTDPGIHDIVGRVFSDLRENYARLFADWAMQEKGMTPDEARVWAMKLAAIAMGLGQGYIAQSALFDDFDGAAYLASASELLPR
jgi:AcrR family transcriptional regulator